MSSFEQDRNALQDIRVHKRHSILETGFNDEEQLPLIDDENEGFN